MSEEPRRLREQAPDSWLGQAVQTARTDLSSTLDGSTEVYWGLRRRLAKPPRRSAGRFWLASLATALAAAVAAPLLLSSGREPARVAGPAPLGASDSGTPTPSWTRIDRGDVGTFELGASADVDIRRLEVANVIGLHAGLLRAQIVKQDPDRPLTVVTPHLRVVVLGTRFDVNVGADVTRVELIEGRVRVESAAGSLLLTAGESAASDDSRLAPPAGEVTAPAVPPPSAATPAVAAPARRRVSTRRDCESERTPEELIACLRALATGTDLTAQGAVYEMGLLLQGRAPGDALALEAFEEYARRFPHGYLAPEVSLRRLALLRGAGRAKDAVAEARSFQEQFAEDPRLGQVLLTRAELSCRDPSEERAARAILDSLGSNPKLRAAAERARQKCGFATAGSRGPDRSPTVPAAMPAPDN